MVLLVTGITGFIGTNFVEYYLNAHEDCKILGLTYSGNLKNFVNMVPWKKSNLEFAKGNITDRKFMDSLFRKNEIDGIVKQIFDVEKPWQLLNPAAPASYGTGEQNVSKDTVAGTPHHSVTLTIVGVEW